VAALYSPTMSNLWRD